MLDAPSTTPFPRQDLSASGPPGGAPDDLDRLLERTRRAFDVRTAALILIEGEDIRTIALAGPAFAFSEPAKAFHRRMGWAKQAFVVPDTLLDDRYGPDMPVAGEPRIRFQAGAPLPAGAGDPSGLLCLFDTRPRRLSAAQKRRLDELAEDMAAALVRRREAAETLRLKEEVEAQAALIREQASALAHRQTIFARASVAAKIGVWECALPDNRLSWTDGVYDMFGLPRGSPLDRNRTLSCYTEASRKALDPIRARAIAERTGFSLEAEIVTARGATRWIRVTATVESQHGAAVRIFGVKQDITEEKALADATRYRAEFDAMTGLANRSLFQSTLTELADRRGGPCRLAALLLIDLDGFKQVNDTYGHALGDECLQETAFRLQSVCGEAELVARIGGDEFAVLLGSQFDGPAIERVAGAIVSALARPIARRGQSFRLGGSVGVARAGACAPSELFTRADVALYAAKAAGRGAFRSFTPAMTMGVSAKPLDGALARLGLAAG